MDREWQQNERTTTDEEENTIIIIIRKSLRKRPKPVTTNNKAALAESEQLPHRAELKSLNQNSSTEILMSFSVFNL